VGIGAAGTIAVTTVIGPRGNTSSCEGARDEQHHPLTIDPTHVIAQTIAGIIVRK
jgi:hypothetical protein